MRKSNTLRKFFLLTNAAFLLPSIPHIANFFLAFENTSQGYAAFFWIGVSYLIAIAIDGTLLWLTHAVSKDAGSWGYRAVIWAFILFLVAFSGYLNWHIAEHNAVAASTNLAGSFIPVVDPIIASMFPVLAIMYAVMARHIFAEAKETPVISLEDLKQKAAEAQERAAAQVAIIKAQNMVNEEKATTAIGFGKTLWNKTINGGDKEAPKTAQNESQSDDNADPKQPLMETVKTPELEQSETPSEVDIEDVQSMPQTEYPDDVLSVLVKFPKVQSWLSGRQRTATIEQVAEVTGLSKRRVQNRLKDGTLKRNSRNANLVHIDSIIEYLKTDPITNRLTGDTGEMPTLQLVANR